MEQFNIYTGKNQKITNQREENELVINNNNDTRCGCWMIKSTKLQNLASKKTLILLFGLSGCFYSSTFAYFNGTITTMEKRFKMPSKTTGIISIGNDISRLLASIVLNYYASRGHRPRWLSFGLYCTATFCFLNALPHLLYGPGEDALQLTIEHGSDYLYNDTNGRHNEKLCLPRETKTCNLETNYIAPPIIWFISQFIVGIGAVLFFSLGYSYLDDNIKKSKSPAIISTTYILRMLGPPLGYLTVSICLKSYISPQFTPTIENSDPRWLGAWWIGWLFLGLILLICATLIAMLPRSLPRVVARKSVQRNSYDYEPKPSVKDMLITVKRLLSNKVYVFKRCGSICHLFGSMPFKTFLPKYIETQYRKSASFTSLLTGSASLVFTATGIILAAIIVQKFKPKARYMACWNTIVNIISLIGIICYFFLGCPAVDKEARAFSIEEYSPILSCSSECSCDYIKFSPVCSIDQSQTFISACHAGCTSQSSLINGTVIYNNCSCITTLVDKLKPINNLLKGGSALHGTCSVDCHNQLYYFIVIICIIKLVGSLSRITNFLISIRCVEERDKSVSLGITLTLNSLFAYIPAPIFFGSIIDSTCLVWGKTCSGKGNCWLFNAPLMRKRIIFTSSVFLLVEIFFDIAVWWNVNELNIFENTDKDSKNFLEIKETEEQKGNGAN